VIGFGVGLAWFRRSTLLPAAIALLNGIAFAAFALAGLPLLGRYLFLAACMLALFTGLAALGFTGMPGGTARARLRWVGLAVVAVLLAFFPIQLGRLALLRSDIAARDAVQDELHALVLEPRVARALATCGRVYLPNHRNVPSLALWTDRPPGDFVSTQLQRPPPRGVFVAPANARVARLSILDPKDPRRLEAHPPPSYRPIARNDAWILYGACPS